MRVELINVNIFSDLIGELASISHGGNLKRDPKELVRDLWKWQHLSPFEFQQWIFKIQAPIFVARQLMRYRTGSYIERSLRYVEPLPDIATLRTTDQRVFDILMKTFTSCLDAYSELLKYVPKEKARAVLPLGTETEFIWRIDSRNLYNVLKQRLDKHAQEETREVAKKILEIVQETDPLLGELYVESLKAEGILI